MDQLSHGRGSDYGGWVPCYLCCHQPMSVSIGIAQLQLSYKVLPRGTAPWTFLAMWKSVHITRYKTRPLLQDTVSSYILLLLQKPQRCVLTRRAWTRIRKRKC